MNLNKTRLDMANMGIRLRLLLKQISKEAIDNCRGLIYICKNGGAEIALCPKNRAITNVCTSFTITSQAKIEVFGHFSFTALGPNLKNVDFSL